jgi:4-hydroxythreonine-4-phosphate dehydrogenase
MSDKIKIGISIGDVNGIGLEVIIKTLIDTRIMNYCTPIVYGHTKVASFHRKTRDVNEFQFHVINDANQAHDKRPNMINCWEEVVVDPSLTQHEKVPGLVPLFPPMIKSLPKVRTSR